MAEAKVAKTIDHGDVHELYADEAIFVLTAKGNVRISLGAIRPSDLKGGVDVHVVGRLVMPASAARKLAEKLIELTSADPDSMANDRPAGVSIQ